MSRKAITSRLLQMLIVLIGISFLTFLLTFISPGDPVRDMYISMGLIPDEKLIAETREQMGLNDPFFTQYFRWLGNCLKGDFGTSFSWGKPVVSLLASRLWPTLKLALISMVLMLIVAVPLGVLSAVNQIPVVNADVVTGFSVCILLVVVFGISLGIGIGRDMVDGILQIAEDDLINLCWVSLRYIILSGHGEQRDVTEPTYQIEIEDGTQGMTLTHIGGMNGFICPVDLLFILDEFVTAVDSLIIASPVSLVEIQV